MQIKISVNERDLFGNNCKTNIRNTYSSDCWYAEEQPCAVL
jgi:hypothetical protein